MEKRQKIIILAIMVLAVVAALLFLAKDAIEERFFAPTGSSLQEGVKTPSENDIEIIAQNLTVPWAMAFLPGGDLLVTERSGTLQRIGNDRQVHKIDGVAHIGEGGLLGLSIHPDFTRNSWLYLYLTSRNGDRLTNRIERYSYSSDRLSHRKVILENIPGAANHDGGRLAFGPDGYLYATTGDAGVSELAQDRNSLAGKILRMTDDGGRPPDNPFGNLVYSYGHRNPQGLAWDGRNRLWASEHGRSGVLSGLDEINLIIKGTNYGWPVIQGGETRQGMQYPVAHSGASETWAPGGLSFVEGSLFFGGLRGQTLYEAELTANEELKLKAHFRNEFGRLRATAISPEGYLYLTTSNTDGRGTPKSGDDKIIRINPEIFR